MMKRLAFSLVLLLGLVTVAPAKGNEVLVLTALDVTQAIGDVLAQGTSVRVENIVPKGYSMQGQDAYFKKHQKAVFAKAKEAVAVLTVGSVWPADPLYKWARRGNIRVVKIDCAKPLDAYGSGVPLVEVEDVPSPFVWRSPANLTRMAAITADDLCRLSPDDCSTIKKNLKTLQVALFKLRSKYEARFLELDIVDLAAFTDGFTYLADEFGLDIRLYELRPEAQWTDQDSARIASLLKIYDVKAVICAWEPDAKGARAISDGGAVPVVFTRYTRQKGSDPVESLIEWYEGNLSRLGLALQH